MTFEWDALDPDIVRVDGTNYLIEEIDRRVLGVRDELAEKRRQRQEARSG